MYIYQWKFSNQKSYIGQTNNWRRRQREEFNAAYNPNSPSYHLPLSKAIRSKLTYDFIVLEADISNDDIDQREQYWIKTLNTLIPNGYNVKWGGQDCGRKQPTEKALGIINALKNDWSNQEIIQKYNVVTSTITLINYGISYHNDEEEYPLRPIHGKRIAQYNLSGELVAIYDSMLEAATAIGISTWNLDACCKKKRPTVGGFHWEWVERGSMPATNIQPIILRQSRMKPLEQWTSDYKTLIKIWPGRCIAEQELGINLANVAAVCQGKRQTTCGFGWRYHKDN